MRKLIEVDSFAHAQPKIDICADFFVLLIVLAARNIMEDERAGFAVVFLCRLGQYFLLKAVRIMN